MDRIAYRTVWAGLTFLVTLATPAVTPTFAADEQPACLKRLTVTGYPHRLKMVAELNALQAWSAQSEKKGKGYSLWHNASGSQVSCKQLKGSVYYRCTAAAQPCLPRQAKVGRLPNSGTEPLDG